MTAKELLQKAIVELEKNNVEFPHLDAEILLSHACGKTREFLFTYPQFFIPPKQQKYFEQFIKKRIKGYSVAVIIGYKYFYNLKFKVDKNVLVPRPETEIMVEDILKQKFDILIDVGTGSGCIILSIFKNLNKKIKKTTKFYALDISSKALKIAKSNAKAQKVQKIIFKQSDLLQYFLKNKKYLKDKNIVIAANLPYLTKRQIKQSFSIQKEPLLALQAGPDGLKYYKRLFKQLKKLKNTFNSCLVYCEIDAGQITTFKTALKQNYPQIKPGVIKDLSKKDRFIVFAI